MNVNWRHYFQGKVFLFQFFGLITCFAPLVDVYKNTRSHPVLEKRTTKKVQQSTISKDETAKHKMIVICELDPPLILIWHDLCALKSLLPFDARYRLDKITPKL